MAKKTENSDVTIKNYPCGMRMIVRPMPGFKSVATSMHIGVGSCNEKPDEHGLAHFVEHMLFKGTERRTAEQIATELSNLGVHYNAYTSNVATCYHTKGLLTNLDDCCDVLSDMFFNLKFADDEFKREAEVIVQEIIMHDDNPRHVLGDLCSEAFFHGTAFEHPIAGTVKSVRSFKPEDIHNFIKKHYTAPNMIISFSGDVTVEQCERVVKKYWLDKFKEKGKARIKGDTGSNIVPKANLAKRKKKIAQHNVAVLFPTVNHWHEDKYKLTFVDGVLSNDMSSRLFASVREKLGLVYSISGGNDLNEIGGFYYIWFSCTPQNTNLVLKTIEDEIAKIKTEGVTEAEVQKVKNVQRANALFTSENVERLNQRSVTQLAELGEIIPAEIFLERIEKITPADVQEATRKYLDMSKAIICVVGDKIKI